MTTLNNALLADILQEVRPKIGQGKVANYIPPLAKVPPHRLGIAVCTTRGEIFQAGDATERFSIQSISKVLSLTLALTLYEDEEQKIWSRVGKEPSGRPFYSLVQLEMELGKPRNPFINAGALVVCDMLQTRLCAQKELKEPKEHMLETVRRLVGDSSIGYDASTAESELKYSDRNAASAYLMRSFGNFKNEVLPVLQTYCHYCALHMSCVELARCFIYLANQGKYLVNQGKYLVNQGKAIDVADQPLIDPLQARRTNALMVTSGMYDGAGEFAYRVGMPAKSGVGGGIIAIIPNEMCIAVWSPELDATGNSLAGTAALEQLAGRLGCSIF